MPGRFKNNNLGQNKRQLNKEILGSSECGIKFMHLMEKILNGL